MDINDLILGDNGGSLLDIRDLPSDGQPAYEDQVKAYEAEVERIGELARVTSCFRTAEGREFLEWFRRHTIDQPHFFPYDYRDTAVQHQLLMLSAEQQGFVREGQDMVYRWITEMMAAVDAGVQMAPPTKPEPAEGNDQ